MTQPYRATPLNIASSVALATLFLAFGQPTCAGIFGASKDDVAIKVATLPTKPDHTLFPFSAVYALGLDFGPDGSRIAVESQSAEVQIWDWRHKHIEKTMRMPQGFGNGVSTNSIKYSPDGRLLAACDGKAAGNIVVRVWTTDTWLTAKDIGDDGPGGCDAFAFTPDGKSLLYVIRRAGNPGNNLIAYAVGTWQLIWGLQITNYDPVSIAISSDGQMAALGGTLTTVPESARDPNASLDLLRRDPTIYLVNLQQRKIQRPVPSSDRGSVAWSPDGARVAIVGGPHVEIFDALSGQNQVREKIEKSGTMNVRFTSDGRFFIDSDLNGMGKGLGVNIWDSQHQKLLQHIPAGDIGSIAVSRDGKLLAIGEAGRTTIWQFK
jgi:WD40 repeat protein